MLLRDQKKIDVLFQKQKNSDKNQASELSDLETLNSDWMSSEEEQDFRIYSASNSLTLSFDEESINYQNGDIILYNPRQKTKEQLALKPGAALSQSQALAAAAKSAAEQSQVEKKLRRQRRPIRSAKQKQLYKEDENDARDAKSGGRDAFILRSGSVPALHYKQSKGQHQLSRKQGQVKSKLKTYMRFFKLIDLKPEKPASRSSFQLNNDAKL